MYVRRLTMKKCFGSLISLFVLLVSFSNMAYSVTIAQSIGEAIKSKIDSVSQKEWKRLMTKQLVQMRFMNEDREWASPELKHFEKSIIPSKVDSVFAEKFIDELIQANEKNEYLISFLKMAQKDGLKDVLEKFEAEGKEYLPEVVAYAIVLNNLTILARNEPEIINISRALWSEAREKSNLWSYLKETEGPIKYYFEKSKLNGVDPVLGQFYDYVTAKNVPPSFLNKELPKNIFMAMLLDATKLNFKNDYAGEILRKNGPIASPTLTADGKAIKFYLPNPEKWADLYSTWNMAFVTTYPHWPLIMTKLLIPQVANHYKASEEYLYNRVYALDVQLNFGLLGRMDGPELLSNRMDWSSKKLTKLWGKANALSAKEYLKSIK